MSIGKRIKECRLDIDLTQDQLAKLAKITQPTLSALERGESQGSTHLSIIADALGVNSFWLETGVGEKFPTGRLTPTESTLVRHYREATPEGKLFIEFSANAAPKQVNH